MENGSFWKISECSQAVTGLSIPVNITVKEYEKALADNDIELLKFWDKILTERGWSYETTTPTECMIPDIE